MDLRCGLMWLGNILHIISMSFSIIPALCGVVAVMANIIAQPFNGNILIPITFH